MYQPPHIGRDLTRVRQEDMLRAASRVRDSREARKAGRPASLRTRMGERVVLGGLWLMRIKPAEQ